MDIRQLRYFVAVAEERHFGRAAERLHMAQPPLSQQIKQLEASLDTTLLERTTRKVELTEAGRLMLERARRVLADLDALAHDVREVGRGAAGVLRVGFAGSATYRLMPSLVQVARAELPGVQLQVQGELLTPDMERALLDNRLDVAVLRPPVQSRQVHMEVLEEERLLAAVPPGHRLAPATGDVSLSELAEEDFIFYPPTSAIATITREACRQAGFRPRIVQEAGETSTLLAFVGAGMGVALVPEGARWAGPHGVAYRPVTATPAVELAVAWSADRRTAFVPAFLELARRASATLASPEPKQSVEPGSCRSASTTSPTDTTTPAEERP
ncbi:LysR substrate-binding domain-containing protein [Georgenia thermotolerans]|uniref:LysR family transcriptional regulator n=1 Tax=Georgenia thermotolerans TaxID=527326 RepID=A0A7J5USR3_9MICO|nr:LysR substrate-binding domain-containing protein [Georgenia thermotolerans]KAE8765492.1 LysR family transcriptional regulator [Georgenia thermotolerans]